MLPDNLSAYCPVFLAQRFIGRDCKLLVGKHPSYRHDCDKTSNNQQYQGESRHFHYFFLIETTIL